MKTSSLLLCVSVTATRYASTSSSSANTSMVVMAKGSKKSKPSSQGSGSNPRRITSNVKQSLQILKGWKELQERRSGTPKPATSYRRKKLPKEVLPEDEVDDDIEDPETETSVMIVDGYNVCGYWPKIQEYFVAGRLDVARKMLITELIKYSSCNDVRVVVVFDAMKSGRRTHKENWAGIDVVFSGETCADLWIDNEVAALKEAGCPTVWVVTSDRVQQESSNYYGAFVWSCRALINEIEDAEKERKERMKKKNHSFEGKLLRHNIDSKVVDALKEMRNKLAEKERNALKDIRNKLAEKERKLRSR